MTETPRFFNVALLLVIAAVCVVAVMFASAVPRHGHGTPDVPMTNDDWQIVSNTGFSAFPPSIKVTDGTDARYHGNIPEDDFRKLLKLLMPFEVTTETPGSYYDYELGYQAGMNPAHIYVDLRNNDMLFWLGRSRFVYRSQSRAAFHAAITSITSTTGR